MISQSVQGQRAYGSLAKLTEGLDTKGIAKHIRATVRQCAKDGLIPSDWVYSVKVDHLTAINVTVGVPDEVMALREAFEQAKRTMFNEAYGCRYTAFRDELVGEWAPLAVLDRTEQMLTEIHNAPNWDGSDVQSDYFDVRYYGHVNMVTMTSFNAYYRK